MPSKQDIQKMIVLLQTMFDEMAKTEKEEWYGNVAQGVAFATNSIPQE